MSELPWNRVSEETYDIRRAQLQLDKDHYGLNKVYLPFVRSHGRGGGGGSAPAALGINFQCR